MVTLLQIENYFKTIDELINSPHGEASRRHVAVLRARQLLSLVATAYRRLHAWFVKALSCHGENLSLVRDGDRI
jgi:hypothetical protein